MFVQHDLLERERHDHIVTGTPSANACMGRVILEWLMLYDRVQCTVRRADLNPAYTELDLAYIEYS